MFAELPSFRRNLKKKKTLFVGNACKNHILAFCLFEVSIMHVYVKVE